MVPSTHAQVDPSGQNLLKDLDDEDEAVVRGLALIQKEQASYWPLMSEDIAAKQPRAKRNKNKDWDGSATRGENVVQLSNLYMCHFCKVGWPQASYLAHVDADMAFISNSDPFLAKTTRIMGLNGFQNLFSNPMDACAKCCQEKHKPNAPYLKIDAVRSDEGDVQVDQRQARHQARDVQQDQAG